MSAANSRAHAPSTSPAPDHQILFKQDRPRKIDRFISFFGDDAQEDDDAGGEQLLDSFGSDQWSER